jgi:hypothetical protein
VRRATRATRRWLAADEAARAEIEALLSPEALRLLKDAEDAFTRSVLGL